jgi:hypothetical protein
MDRMERRGETQGVAIFVRLLMDQARLILSEEQMPDGPTGHLEPENGRKYARDLLRALPPPPPPPPTVPLWDAKTMTLWFGETRLCQWKKWAMNQHRVLDAFQKAGWLSTVVQQFGGESLRQAVRELNAKLQGTPLMFRRDGSGSGVTWQLA